MTTAKDRRTLREFKFCFNPDHNRMADYEAAVEALERLETASVVYRDASAKGRLTTDDVGELATAQRDARAALARLRSEVPT